MIVFCPDIESNSSLSPCHSGTCSHIPRFFNLHRQLSSGSSVERVSPSELGTYQSAETQG
jgi:hypothetical protein